MTRRTRRTGLVDPSRELTALIEARRALCRILAAYPISGLVYVSAGNALEALDRVAEAITGDPQALMDPAFRGPL